MFRSNDRVLSDPIDDLPKEIRRYAVKRAQPAWFPPMLATLVAEAFSAEDWIYESKLDGERCLTFGDGKKLHLFSRNRKELNNTYPELVTPLADQPVKSYIADGEVVAFKDGVSSFSQLQRRMQVRDPEEARRRGVEVSYYIFDLLYLNGYDLRKVPLLYRKALLRQNLKFRRLICFTEHREREGEEYFQEACRKRWEGLVAKRAGSETIEVPASHAVYISKPNEVAGLIERAAKASAQ